jgi:hypothetical protein
MIEIVKVCPLGKKCSEIVDGKVHECMWFTTIQGQNPQTGEQVDKQDCTINNMTLFLADMALSNRQVVANSNDARNTAVEAISALAIAVTTQSTTQENTVLKEVITPKRKAFAMRLLDKLK